MEDFRKYGAVQVTGAGVSISSSAAIAPNDTRSEVTVAFDGLEGQISTLDNMIDKLASNLAMVLKPKLELDNRNESMPPQPPVAPLTDALAGLNRRIGRINQNVSDLLTRLAT